MAPGPLALSLLAVVEDRQRPVGPAAGVVLVAGGGAGGHLEIAPLAVQPPQDLAALAVDLVGGRGLAGRDDEVPVGVHLYGVYVEVVEGLGRVLRRREVRLFYTHPLEAVPLEEHLPRLDVQLLHDPLRRHAVNGAAHRGEVVRREPVDGDEGGVLPVMRSSCRSAW
jgi:hypothetical protein